MKPIWKRFDRTMWTGSLVALAVAMALNRFGQSVFGAARTNFFVDTLGLSGGQVLWLEGIREIPGLALMFIAALTMHLALSQRAAVSLLIAGIGYGLYAFTRSYTALLAMAVFASLGLHLWMPLSSALSMSLSSKERTGRVVGALSSVGSLAALAGMGVLALVSKLFASIPLGTYYIVGGAFMIIAALLVWRLPTSIGATAQEQPRMLLKGRYWLFYVLTFFQGSRKQVLNTFTTLILVDQFGLEVWQISLLLLASSVINMLAGPVVGALVDRFGERSTVSLSYVVLLICCTGFALVHTVWVLVLLLLVMKLAVMFGLGLNTYVYRLAPEEELTPTLSAGISINHVTSVGMPLLAGALLPVIGYGGVFLGTAGLILLSVPFALQLHVGAPAERRVEAVQAGTAATD
ncbi:MAG: MFS transporter [Anaerolineae bacterium]